MDLRKTNAPEIPSKIFFPFKTDIINIIYFLLYGRFYHLTILELPKHVV